jgi:hypothetical protein
MRIGRLLRGATALCAAAALAACAAAGSAPGGLSGEGIAYSLPSARVLLTASLNQDRDSLLVEASEPAYVPDEDHSYVLRPYYSPANADKLQICVTPEGFLTTVNLESDGRLDESLIAAAESAASLFESAARAENRIILFEEMIDPEAVAANPAALRDLNFRLNAALSQMRTKGREARELNALKRHPQPVQVRVERLFRPAAPETVARGAQDCAEGVCYRRLSTYALTLRFADGAQRMVLFGAPNGSPTYVAPVDRGLFTTWKTDLTLQNGVLTGYKIESGSELEAAAALPAEMVGAVIQGITKRGQLFNSRATLVEAETKLVEAQASARRRTLAAQRESAIQPGASMMRVSIGAEAGEPPAPRMQLGFGATEGALISPLAPISDLVPPQAADMGDFGGQSLPSDPGEP